ncbi:hypothetical protein Pfo_004956 [Paulownia fortunei]|nr:hypothetical protein Pfo_004956 [Paulownia fortunei]
MATWAQICSNLHGLKPTLIMVLVQAIFAVVNIGYKLAANDGMRLSVLVGYRFMFGAAFIVPVAFFVERKKRPKLTRKIVFYGFLCGLFGGSLGQNLYLKSLALTSATFASAMTNLIPAMTFVIAICLRLERLGWNTSAGKAKVFGTIIGIGGAMLLTFYKGTELNLWNTNINLLETTTTHHPANGQTQNHQGGHNLVMGALLAMASCVCYSLWLIVQAKVAEQYPCPYSITAMMTVWASIQGVAFALCTERDWSNWILGWNIRLLTVAVAGILGSGVMFTFVAWCVRMRGPLFVSIFNPLLLVMVAIGGSLLLEEKLHLGMVLGGLLIVGGLYVVLWGKGKELKKVSQLMPENQEKQVQVDMPPPPPPPPPPQSGSSHGGSGSRKEAEEEREEEKRDSQASSDVLGGLYMFP